jgi:hypothetical protein
MLRKDFKNHNGVEVTESSTNKQYTLSSPETKNLGAFPVHLYCILKEVIRPPATGYPPMVTGSSRLRVRLAL